MSLAVVDLGVGIVEVRGRSSGFEDTTLCGAWTAAVEEGGRRGEDRDVSVERGDGVDGSIVGEGGSGTRATASSSRSASVRTKVVPMMVC